MSSAISSERSSPTQANRPERHSRTGRARTSGVVVAALLGLLAFVPSAVASGSAQGPPAGPTTPPFFQCPAIGLDTSCQFLIDVTSANPEVPPTILENSSQSFYDGNDDVTVAIQNDSSAPLSSVHLGVNGSGDDLFGLDGDGLCNPGSGPSPEGCPFGPPGNNESPFDYFGPDTVLTAEPGSFDAGTVAFTTPLQPGQYTYFSLEAPPVPNPYIVAGNVNDTVTTELTDQENPEVPTGATIAVPAPAAITDKATIAGPNAFEASGTVTYKVYSDPNCTKEVANGGTMKVANGVAEASNPVGVGKAALPTNAKYYWVAEYSGNKGEHENTPATSVCGGEVMTFGTPPTPPKPTITTVLSGGGQVGTQIVVPEHTAVTDTATIVAPEGQPVTGRLSYEIYTDSHCFPFTQVKGAGEGMTTGSGPASNPVVLGSGTYYFQASYSGNGVLGSAVSPCGSEVLTVTSPSPPPPPPLTSQFTSVGNPQVNTKNGQIVVIGQFPAPGTATSTGVVPQGATLARFDGAAQAARAKRCKHHFVKKHRRCVNNESVIYGSTTLAIPAPGTYSIVISPTGKVLKALKAGKRLKVVITTAFQNHAGGAPVAHVQDVSVKLRKTRHGKHRHGRR